MNTNASGPAPDNSLGALTAQGATARAERRWMPHLLTLLLYAAGVALILLNLWPAFGAAVIGKADEMDYGIFLWGVWWTPYALFTLGQSPLYTDYIVYPFENNLAFHVHATFWGPIHAALQPVFGRIGAFNLLFVVSFVLAGYFTFLFLRPRVNRDWLAALGGFMFAFAPTVVDRARGAQLDIMAVWWLPLALLLWDRVVAARDQRRSALWAAGVGLAVWGAWITHAPFLMFLPLLSAPYALYTVWAAPRDRRLWLFGMALLALLVTALLGAVYPLPATLDVLRDDPANYPVAELHTQRFHAAPLSALVGVGGDGDRSLGFLLPWLVYLAILTPVLSRFVRRGDPPARSGSRPNRLHATRERWLWLGTGAACALLALGPDIEVAGARVPLPYMLLWRVQNGQYRTPSRFLLPGALALITFVVMTAPWWVDALQSALRRYPPRRIAAGAFTAAVILFSLDYGVARPLPVHAVPDYPIYHEIGAEDGDYVVLQVPLGTGLAYWPTGRRFDLMHYGGVHHKKQVSGLLSRAPWQVRVYYEEKSALLSAVAFVRPLDTQAAPRELAKAVDEWPLGYIVIHRNYLSEPEAREMAGFFNMQESVCFVRAEADLMIYRAHWHPKGCPPRTPPQDATGAYVLDLGAPGDEGFIGEYWYWQEDVGGVGARWAGGNDASRLRVALPGGRDYRMTLVATGYGEGQGVEVRVNGAVLGGCELAGGWSACEVGLPARVVGEGDLVVVLVHRGMASAAGRGESADARPLTAAYDRIIFKAVQ